MLQHPLVLGLFLTVAASTGCSGNPVMDWSRVVYVQHGVHLTCFDLDSGKEIQSPRFYLEHWAGVPTLSEGLFRATLTLGHKRKTGFIEPSGRVVVGFRFDAAGSFRDGRATVVVGEESGIIDKDGNWIVRPGKYFCVGDCHEGVIAFQRHEHEPWGFVDKNGNEVLPPKYVNSWAPWFTEGLCLINEIVPKNPYCIDKRGRLQFVVPQEYLPSTDRWNSGFRNGLARISTGPPEFGGKEGFMDTAGRVAIPMRYSSVGEFSDGLAAVSLGSMGQFVYSEYRPQKRETPGPPETWGFINTSGKLVIPMVYDQVGHFCDGLAPVCQKGKWGYLDMKGLEILSLRYDYAESFQRGIAMVSIGGKIAFIEKTGKILVMTDIDYVEFD